MRTVSRFAVAPVKSLGLVHPQEIDLERTGVAENRRYYLVDGAGRLLNGTRCAKLVGIIPRVDPESGRLALQFPNGAVVEGEVTLGPRVATDWSGRFVRGRIVEGPWEDALSDYVAAAVRLVQAERAGAACAHAPVSLLSDASVERVARHVGRTTPLDERRFRMLMGIGGCEPHDEDTWIGKRVTVGDAVVRILAPTARCVVTTRDPQSGVRDFDTLHVIKELRGLSPRRTLDLGVYGAVERPGRVRVGDPVVPE